MYLLAASARSCREPDLEWSSEICFSLSKDIYFAQLMVTVGTLEAVPSLKLPWTMTTVDKRKEEN